ncbi:MAG: TRAP transporter small permease [Candidatus Eiseniibacteriota bacterium]
MSEELPRSPTEPRSRLGAVVETGLGAASSIVLFGIMTVTVVDVVGRYLLDAPLPAAYEIIQICMGFLVFLIVPVLTLRDEDIRIDVFQQLFPRPLRPALKLISKLVSLIVIVGFGWFLLRRGLSFASSGETTSNLRFPLAPLAFFIALSWAVSAVAAAGQLIALMRGAPRDRRS